MALTAYNDIPNRQLQKAMLPFLKAAMPNLVSERFGQTFVQGEHQSKVAIFRRINKLPNTPVALVDGVTPAGVRPTSTDITVSLEQYGNFINYTDQMVDLGEPQVLAAYSERLGQQAAEVAENIRLGVLRACTNVYYNASTTASAAGVNQIMAGANGLTMQRKVVRGLMRQDARKITRVVDGSPKFNTTPVEEGYVAICHTDLAKDIRDVPGFIPTAEYGSRVAYPGELGSVEDVRYITTTLMTPDIDAGTAIASISGSALSTSGTSADVYPIIYLGADAFGTVVLRGKFAAQLLASPPKATAGDELAQRGSIGWKGYLATVICNDLWMAVGKTAASV
jgi:N4-gp56 family major capsid protein